MVGINHRFTTTLLATACTLSSISQGVPVTESTSLQSLHSRDGLSSATSSGDIRAMEGIPVQERRQQILELPKAALMGSLAPTKPAKSRKRFFDGDPTNPISRVVMRLMNSRALKQTAQVYVAMSPAGSKRAIAAPPEVDSSSLEEPAPSPVGAPAQHYYDPAHRADVTNEGEDNKIVFDRRHHHHHHHHGDYNKVIVKGNDDRVRIHNRDWEDHTLHVSARDPHHHHHHHGDYNKVVVKGDHDRVHISNRDAEDVSPELFSRDPHHHHHHHHHGVANKVVIKGDDDRVRISNRDAEGLEAGSLLGREPHHHHRHGKHGKTLVVKGDHKTVNLLRREDLDGAKGRVDIMSATAAQGDNSRVASLCLGEDFVLNACDSNPVAIYLSPIDEVSPSSATTWADSTLTQILLKIPVYDQRTAKVIPYCATFDPNPSEPEPLTAEECADDTARVQEHTSQIFEYDQSTGVVRPMWSNAGAPQPGRNTAGMPEPQSASATPLSPTDPPSTMEAGAAAVTSASGILRRQDTPSTSPPQAQNVTLIFVPEAPVAKGAALKDQTTTTGVPLPTSSGTTTAPAATVDPTPTSAQPPAAAEALESNDSTAPRRQAGALNVIEVAPADVAPTLAPVPEKPTVPGAGERLPAPPPTTTGTTTTINAAAIASNIAAERKERYRSQGVDPVTATQTSSSTVSTVSPTGIQARNPDMRPLTVAPLNWKFGREV